MPKPLIVNLDEARSLRTNDQKKIQNRLRESLRPKGERFDHSLYEGSLQILALDPGGTTGWSVMEVAPEALSNRPEHRGVSLLKNIIRWRHGQVDCGSKRGDLGTSGVDGLSVSGEAAGVSELLGLIRCWPNAAVVIEDFILDPDRFNTGRDLLSPVRITSGISYDLWLQKRRYEVQSASLAKSTCRDEQLKAWGYYSSTGGLQHARDADRHALTFLKRAAQSSVKGRQLRVRSWPHLFGKGREFEQ